MIKELWSVYLIRTYYNALYTGITTDVERRLKEHNAQGHKCAKSLRGKSPLKLVFSKKIGCKSDALKLEYRIKKLSKPDKELLVQSKKIPMISKIE